MLSNIKKDIYTTSQSKAQRSGYHSLLQARPKEECVGQRCPSLFRWLFPPWRSSTNEWMNEYFLITKCCSLIRSFTIEITNTSVWSLNWPLHPTQWHCPSERHNCCCEASYRPRNIPNNKVWCWHHYAKVVLLFSRDREAGQSWSIMQGSLGGKPLRVPIGLEAEELVDLPAGQRPSTCSQNHNV